MAGTDDRDDYADLTGRVHDNPPSFPQTVMIAGLIWIGVGVLGFASTVMRFIQAAQNQPGVGPLQGCCSGLFAAGFFYCGYQTVTGRAMSTTGFGIVSFVLGVPIAVFAVVVGIQAWLADNQGPNAPRGELIVVFAAVVGLQAANLLTAGVLALAGRERYEQWRRHYLASSPRRRYRTPNESDA